MGFILAVSGSWSLLPCSSGAQPTGPWARGLRALPQPAGLPAQPTRRGTRPRSATGPGIRCRPWGCVGDGDTASESPALGPASQPQLGKATQLWDGHDAAKVKLPGPIVNLAAPQRSNSLTDSTKRKEAGVELNAGHWPSKRLPGDFPGNPPRVLSLGTYCVQRPAYSAANRKPHWPRSAGPSPCSVLPGQVSGSPGEAIEARPTSISGNSNNPAQRGGGSKDPLTRRMDACMGERCLNCY